MAIYGCDERLSSVAVTEEETPWLGAGQARTIQRCAEEETDRGYPGVKEGGAADRRHRLASPAAALAITSGGGVEDVADREMPEEPPCRLMPSDSRPKGDEDRMEINKGFFG